VVTLPGESIGNAIPVMLYVNHVAEKP
jgi:hypothetical protein